MPRSTLPAKLALRRNSRRAARIALACAVSIAIVAASRTVNQPGPLVLWNASPSEPKGLFARTSLAASTGRLAAFMAPSAAFPYADRNLGYLHHTRVLKALAAGPGSLVCTTSGRLVIDGKPKALVAVRDPLDDPLPRWNACRRLRTGEWFAYSDRVPNSFDSRYFGPITTGQIIAIYRPLWISPKEPS
jgi:conjugative transfer signal peptidase TraF